ncbi:endothelin-converting enzyme homolog isoform X2 [Rhipicephalus microplus]|uniref:endothelin-converting enzyme homolog isoform X2 n=1 Tax=Rhipicephalus microplus TaxID=6941 RepID=UPI003F6D28DC
MASAHQDATNFVMDERIATSAQASAIIDEGWATLLPVPSTSIQVDNRRPSSPDSFSGHVGWSSCSTMFKPLLLYVQSEPLFHKGYPPLNDVAGGAKRRWNCLPLAALGIVVPGLLSSLLLIMCMNANESRDTNAPTEDTLAALNVPEMPVTRVTRSTEEPAPLPWNIMTTTPPEQRAVVPSSHLEGDECVGILCRYVAITLRSTLDFRADPCNDFYRYVCGKFQGDDVFRRVQNVINTGTFVALKFTEAPLANQSAFEKAVAMYKACVGFASAYQPETIELARWMIAMNLDFLNPTRLETIDPVEMMVRGSLELGVEAIISIRFMDRRFFKGTRLVEIHYSSEQSNWSYQRRYKWPRTNEEYYSRLFLMYGVMRAEAYLFSKKILAYEEQPEWSTLFSKYTEGIYRGSDTILHFIHSTSIIKRLFEDEYVGKVGLQYLVAWSIYRQLVKFTEPYMFRGEKKVDEVCFVHVRNVMSLAILSEHFYSFVSPRMIEGVRQMAFRIRDTFGDALNASSWLTTRFRRRFTSKLYEIKVQAGSPGDRIEPGFVETFYETLPDVPVNRLFPSWIAARRLHTRYSWKDQENPLYNEGEVGAYYTIDKSIIIPIAIVHQPFYYEYGPVGLNYGGLGMIIGHEFMHAFDVSTLEDYWGTEEIRNEYTKRALCLRRSHRSVLSLSGQEELLNETVDSENLGDLVGTRLAYEAFTSLPEEYKRVTPAGFNMSSERLFFINLCNQWCARNSKPTLRHAPPRSRCIVPLRNMPEFSRAFGCAARTPMNPDKKCTFW